jgi:signal transduction histidine kinase
MRYFFWAAFAVFLAASIPHVAYFFNSFEPANNSWSWAVSYSIAISIDVTIYLLSWTAFQRYRRYRSWRAVWQHWLLILLCTLFSWAMNWAYSKQFHSTTALSVAEQYAPWLANIFPFLASSFPLLGIVYTMMAETITDADQQEHMEKLQRQLATVAEVNRSRLTIGPAGSTGPLPSVAASTRPALASPSRPATPDAVDLLAGLDDLDELGTNGNGNSGPISGPVLAIGHAQVVSSSGDSGPLRSETEVADKLQLTIEALTANPNITDDVLAEYLSLKKPASARYWRLKAMEVLTSTSAGATGQTAAMNGSRRTYGDSGSIRSSRSRRGQ